MLVYPFNLVIFLTLVTVYVNGLRFNNVCATLSVMKMRIFLSTIMLFFAANFAGAQVAITEIMYDLEGTDADREWIELQNTSGFQVDLEGWKFFEQDTNHKLTPAGSGSFLLPAGSGEIF